MADSAPALAVVRRKEPGGRGEGRGGGVSELVGVLSFQSPHPPPHHAERVRDSESRVTQRVRVPADAPVTHGLSQLGLGRGEKEGVRGAWGDRAARPV